MKSKNLFILLGFILLLIAFYWFQIRPGIIRSKCSNLSFAIDRHISVVGIKNLSQEQISVLEKLKEIALSEDVRNTWYRKCLASYGLKPEDLY